MAFEIIDKTSFKLRGLEAGISENWESEGYYGEEGDYDRLSHAFYRYTFGLGYDAYIDAQGEKQRWFGGPNRPAKNTADPKQRKVLDKRWYAKRIKDTVAATPEMQWIKANRYKAAFDVKSYNRSDGSVVITMDERQLTFFKLGFVA